MLVDSVYEVRFEVARQALGTVDASIAPTFRTSGTTGALDYSAGVTGPSVTVPSDAPEPGSLAMLCAALAGGGAIRRLRADTRLS